MTGTKDSQTWRLAESNQQGPDFASMVKPRASVSEQLADHRIHDMR
jgi:hypothetical protein